MSGLARSTVRTLVDTLVAAESAVLERPPRSIEEVGEPIIVATHRRSGTHLTIDTLRRNFPECRPRMLPLENQHKSYFNIDAMNADHPTPHSRAEALRILGKSARPTIKTHAEPGFGEVAPEHQSFVRSIVQRSRSLYISRDGRKVMCSLWAWRGTFDPGSRVPFAEFIRQTDGRGRSRPREWAEHVLAWLDAPGVVHYAFDRLVRDPAATLAEIGERFGLRLEPADPAIPPAVRSRRETWIARLRGDLTSTNQHIRGKRPPRPDEVFTAEDEAFFEREAGGAMERLNQAVGG